MTDTNTCNWWSVHVADKQSNRGRETRELTKERRTHYIIVVTSLALTCSLFNSTPTSMLNFVTRKC